MSWSWNTSTAQRSIPASSAATCSFESGFARSQPETSPAMQGVSGRIATVMEKWPSRTLRRLAQLHQLLERVLPGVLGEADVGLVVGEGDVVLGLALQDAALAQQPVEGAHRLGVALERVAVVADLADAEHDVEERRLARYHGLDAGAPQELRQGPHELAAGLASMAILKRPGAYERIFKTGRELKMRHDVV